MKLLAFMASVLVTLSLSVIATSDGGESYEVSGVKEGDILKVRADAGASFAEVGRLEPGARGILIISPPVFNGPDDWVKIRRGDLVGWVRPKYLRVELSQPLDSPMPDPREGSLSTIEKSPETIRAWLKYQEITENDRMPKMDNPSARLAGLEMIALEGIHKTVRNQIEDDVALTKVTIQVVKMVQDLGTENLPNRAMREAFRRPAEEIGAEMMPKTGAPEGMRKGAGALLGQFVIDYCFQDTPPPQSLYDAAEWMLVEADRLTTQEALITSALGLEHPTWLHAALESVQERSYANRLRQGQWIAKDSGVIFDLKITDDIKARSRAAGYVQMFPRGKRGDPLSFQWIFDEGHFLLKERSFLTTIGYEYRLIPRFTSPDAFELYKDSGEFFGSWERIRRR